VPIFWTDIQILQALDEAERGEASPISNGLALIQTVSARMGAQPMEADYISFLRELLVLAKADLMTWKVPGYAGSIPPPQTSNAFDYVQRMLDPALTIDGRDRARGEVIRVPMPDPVEDDGRLIRASTLADVAREIGEGYTPTQTRRLLLESGISAQHVEGTEGPDSESLLVALFTRLADGTSGERRELRGLVGAWLDNWLHTGPTAAVYRSITADFARQGWFVRAGRLVVGDPVRGASLGGGEIARDARLGALHDRIRSVSQRPFEAGEPAAAVFEAFKPVNSRVKDMTGLELDGRDLMAQAFRSEEPLLVLPSASDARTMESIQSGYRFLFMGAMAAIRNPHAHGPSEDLSENEALERLGFASFLMRRLDDARLAMAPEE
jgi:uncharacterized protein (TIGR02391 family)